MTPARVAVLALLSGLVLGPSVAVAAKKKQRRIPLQKPPDLRGSGAGALGREMAEAFSTRSLLYGVAEWQKLRPTQVEGDAVRSAADAAVIAQHLSLVSTTVSGTRAKARPLPERGRPGWSRRATQSSRATLTA